MNRVTLNSATRVTVIHTLRSNHCELDLHTAWLKIRFTSSRFNAISRTTLLKTLSYAKSDVMVKQKEIIMTAYHSQNTHISHYPVVPWR